MELKEGMYVRTNQGIGTIHHISGDKIYSVKLNKGHIKKYVNILKEPSFNILDLIEEGDLLKIEYFSQRYAERVTRLFEVTYLDGKCITLENSKCYFILKNKKFSEKDKLLDPVIKRIITEQQLDSIAYGIGGQN